MKTRFKQGLLAVMGCLLLSTGCQRKAEPMRLMSYNIRNLRGMDDTRDLQRVARVINEANADVVALQEVDSVTGRSGQTDVLALLAAETQMHPVYAAAIDYDGGKYGVGILSREKPLAHHKVPLPGQEEQRVLLVVEFERYVMACTHLSLTDEDRLNSLPILLREAEQAGKPFFIAGDWNAEPSSPFIEALKQSFTLLSDPTRLTFPAPQPDRTLDYVAVFGTAHPSASTDSTWVIAEPMASDHRPVMVTTYY